MPGNGPGAQSEGRWATWRSRPLMRLCLRSFSRTT